MPNSNFIKGVIIVDQIKSMDWQACNIEYIEKGEKTVINRVKQKLGRLIN